MKEIEGQLACNCGEYFTRLRVKKGRLPDVPLEAEHELVVPLPQDEKDSLVKDVNIYPPPAAPVKLGQYLGEVIFTWRGQELGRTNLIAGREVKERPWYWALRRRYF
jgi:D-alanyl-D-alanine carboxypeptidase (penicillin-binding protein 5/6)